MASAVIYALTFNEGWACNFLNRLYIYSLSLLVDYIYALLFLLFSIKVTQQPSIGLTNGDGSSTPEAAKSTSSDDTIFNDTPPISNKYDMPALEKTSSKTIGSYKF